MAGLRDCEAIGGQGALPEEHTQPERTDLLDAAISQTDVSLVAMPGPKPCHRSVRPHL